MNLYFFSQKHPRDGQGRKTLVDKFSMSYFNINWELVVYSIIKHTRLKVMRRNDYLLIHCFILMQKKIKISIKSQNRSDRRCLYEQLNIEILFD